MPTRQIWLFKAGCWGAFVAAAVHLVGSLYSPAPANETERQLRQLATTYHYAMPGGSMRSLMDFVNGFSLVFALLLVTMGAVGLVVERRAHADVAVMNELAKVLAMASVLLLVISLVYFFIVPTLFIAFVTCCFTFAAVRPPIEMK